MEKIKKVCLVAALAAMSVFGVRAQQLQLGLTAGLNVNSVSLNQSPISQAVDGQNYMGWFLGVKAELPLFLGLGVDGALVYNERKYGLKGTGVRILYTTHVASKNLSLASTYRTLDIPLNLRYSFSVANMNLFLATGPEFSMNVKKSSLDLNDLIDGNIEGKFKQPGVTASWNYAVGARFNGLELSLGYNKVAGNLGEAAVTSVGLSGTNSLSYKLNSWRLQATYYF